MLTGFRHTGHGDPGDLDTRNFVKRTWTHLDINTQGHGDTRQRYTKTSTHPRHTRRKTHVISIFRHTTRDTG